MVRSTEDLLVWLAAQGEGGHSTRLVLQYDVERVDDSWKVEISSCRAIGFEVYKVAVAYRECNRGWSTGC